MMNRPAITFVALVLILVYFGSIDSVKGPPPTNEQKAVNSNNFRDIASLIGDEELQLWGLVERLVTVYEEYQDSVENGDLTIPNLKFPTYPTDYRQRKAKIKSIIEFSHGQVGGTHDQDFILGTLNNLEQQLEHGLRAVPIPQRRRFTSEELQNMPGPSTMEFPDAQDGNLPRLDIFYGITTSRPDLTLLRERIKEIRGSIIHELAALRNMYKRFFEVLPPGRRNNP